MRLQGCYSPPPTCLPGVGRERGGRTSSTQIVSFARGRSEAQQEHDTFACKSRRKFSKLHRNFESRHSDRLTRDTYRAQLFSRSFFRGVAQHDAGVRGKRARILFDETLPSLPSSPTKHRKFHERARGGASGKRGSAAGVAAETAGREVHTEEQQQYKE